MYIIYYTSRSHVQNIVPEVCVRGCDIAQGPKVRGLYHIQGHKPQVLYSVYETVLVYYIGIMMTAFLHSRSIYKI